MTFTISKQVEGAVEQVARSVGFARQSKGLWTRYVETGAFTLVLYLQASRWGRKFYIELGAASGTLREGMEIYDVPLRMRIESCVEDADRMRRLLDFEKDDVDIDGQIRALKESVGPATHQFSSIQTRRDLADFIAKCTDLARDGKHSSFMVPKPFLDELQS